MSDSDFEKAFGSSPRSAPFAQRVGRADMPHFQNEKETAVGSGPYKPYGFLPSGNIGETCEISSWLPGDVPHGLEFPYRYLMCIQFTGEQQIKLHLPEYFVIIEGKFLRDLRKRLARRQVTFIQQWSSHIWPKRPPKGEPIIEKIELIRPKVE